MHRVRQVTRSIRPVSSAHACGTAAALSNAGAMAYIHLTGFPDGGTYAVLKSGSSKVTGVTKNGTKFTCIKK